MSVTVTLPLYLPSIANVREHWARKAKRAKTHRQWARNAVWAAFSTPFRDAPQVTVTITRIARRPLDDDNAVSSCKNVRDGIADALGMDDRDPRLTFRYAQEKVSAPKSLKDAQVGRVRVDIQIGGMAA